MTIKLTPRTLGIAAAYLAAALMAAMIYFLVGTDYPSVTDPVAKVALLVDQELAIHVMYLIAYVGFGLALTVLALGLPSRMPSSTARVSAAIGVIWAGMLIASGMVYIVGMSAVVDLQASDPAAAVAAWQAIEPVALGLGGAGGEALGGTWVLLVSIGALQAHVLPRWLVWLGLVVGAAGILSVAPGLAAVSVVFGLLVTVWLVGLAVVLLRQGVIGAPGPHAEALVAAR